ncbi:hypothetical protein GLAREA_03985 [Glarea lozoyensis ATCC 20868]|uniref:Uncharacterized protein n=1 Tax=Glarea lozoyensis (strain ATCC 20868 / MF5171) TaxID=1116229 RepID=S3DXC2_GLAL2|nr:uncharacterized protein GLAREA_03985 [Glarea lozoyensis ATCC 20868]EPE31018.1 hypothetical protein GLAREA_03985 [Glarea lozoyensis ATCC 20868]
MATTKQSLVPNTVLVSDIVNYTDSELDRYIAMNGRSIFADPKTLTEDFLQRLRDRASGAYIPAQSLVDLDEVTNRLEKEGPERLARAPSPPSTLSMDDEESYHYDLDQDTDVYNCLVSEGGRPSHPVSLGRDILADPGPYRDIISYWQNGNEQNWRIFESQQGEWRTFCVFQRTNRCKNRFPKFVKILQDTLARHDFKHPYTLSEDPKVQDKLSMWIEFLAYENWLYDKDMAFLSRNRPQYVKAWKKLVDSNVLRPDETEESVWKQGFAGRLKDVNEEEAAGKAVEAAKVSVTLAENRLARSSHSDTASKLLPAAAQSQLDTAVRRFESIKRRIDGLIDFESKTYTLNVLCYPPKRSYQLTTHDAERRPILIRWIVEQIPLIKAELESVIGSENRKKSPNIQKPSHEGRKTGTSPPKNFENLTLDHLVLTDPTAQQEKPTDPNGTSGARSPLNSRRTLRSPLAKRPTIESGATEANARRAKKAKSKSSIKETSCSTGKADSNGSTAQSYFPRRSTRTKRPPDRFQ